MQMLVTSCTLSATIVIASSPPIHIFLIENLD